jgi:hypothetical protein
MPIFVTSGIHAYHWKEITVDYQGRCFIFGSGLARLLGTQGINQGAEQMPKELAKTFTQQGIKLSERPLKLL